MVATREYAGSQPSSARSASTSVASTGTRLPSPSLFPPSPALDLELPARPLVPSPPAPPGPPPALTGYYRADPDSFSDDIRVSLRDGSGSREMGDEGRIYLNPQSWAMLAGTLIFVGGTAVLALRDPPFPPFTHECQFRVLVLPASGTEWPAQRYLRQGVRTNGWVLLNQVKLGYELWRQLNGFPPVVSQAEPKDAKGEKPPKVKM